MNNFAPNDSMEPLLSNCRNLLNKFLYMNIYFEKLANICKDALNIRGTSLPCTFVNFVN